MANRIIGRADFIVPPELFTEHEWLADGIIDSESGKDCTLYYPDKWTECDNCYIDLDTQRSSNIYKSGGPVSFPAHSICPRCNGAGRAQVPVMETIRLRVYWTPKSWLEMGIEVANPDGAVLVIGYMTDLHKLEQANKILVQADVADYRQYMCVREGEAQPWGFRGRYFAQMLRRAPGG